jgi:hypothetical protein
MDQLTPPVRAAIANRVRQQQLPPTATPLYDIPHLPLEIWSQVLQQVDDPLILWVTCRRVSRIFKRESEHAFRLAFLPYLRLSWCLGTPDWAPRFEVTAQLDTTVQLPSHKDNVQIAAFTVFTSGSVDPYGDHQPLSHAKRMEYVRLATDYKDTKFRQRDETRYVWGAMRWPYHALCVSFVNCNRPENCHVNDPETDPIWLCLDNESTFTSSPAYQASGEVDPPMIKAGVVFLNWHALLNAFFTEIRMVRIYHPAPTVDFKTLLAKAKHYITSRCPYLSPQANFSAPLHGIISNDEIFVTARSKFHKAVETAYNASSQSEGPMYWEAYTERVGLAQKRSGTGWVPDARSEGRSLDEHVARLREARGFLVQRYAEDLWDAEFGDIDFEYEDVEGEVGFIASDFE